MPTKGFEAIAPVLLMLRDEVLALRLEVNESRKATQKDYKSLEQLTVLHERKSAHSSIERLSRIYPYASN